MSDAVIGLTVVVAFMAFIIFMVMFVAVGVIVVVKITNTHFTGPLMIPLTTMPSQVPPPEKSNNDNISSEIYPFIWEIRNKFPDLFELLAFVQSQKKTEDEKLKKQAEEKALKEAKDEKLKEDAKEEAKKEVLRDKLKCYANIEEMLKNVNSVKEVLYNHIANISSVADADQARNPAGASGEAQAQSRNPAGGGGEAPPAAI